MVWNKEELKKVFETRQFTNDPDFDMINGDWIRSKREVVLINCDILKNKKKLSKHELFEWNLCQQANF